MFFEMTAPTYSIDSTRMIRFLADPDAFSAGAGRGDAAAPTPSGDGAAPPAAGGNRRRRRRRRRRSRHGAPLTARRRPSPATAMATALARRRHRRNPPPRLASRRANPSTNHSPSTTFDSTMPANSLRSDRIWMDGAMVPYDEATVHVLTHSLHYGLAYSKGCDATRATRPLGDLPRPRAHPPPDRLRPYRRNGSPVQPRRAAQGMRRRRSHQRVRRMLYPADGVFRRR